MLWVLCYKGVDAAKNISSNAYMLIPKTQRVLLVGLSVAYLCASSLQSAVLTGVNPTIFTVGTGVDISYLVIDESSLYSTPLEFIYHYTYDSNNLLTGEQMMQSITNSTSLGFTIGTTYGELLSLSYAGTTVSGTDFLLPDGFYWSYFVLGGSDAGSAPTDPNQWNYANSGISSRTISPGSWDGETLSGWGTNSAIGGPPSVSPSAVPEPSALPLVLLALTGMAIIIRWKSTKRCILR